MIEPSFRLQWYASLSTVSPEPRLSMKYNVTDRFRLKFAGGLYSQNLISATSDRDVVNLFYGFLSGRPDFLDLALVYALMNFIGTIAVMKFARFGDLAGMEDDSEEIL